MSFSTAEMSLLKWRLISSIGITWEYPPPAAPPLMPKKPGQGDGSRNTTSRFFYLKVKRLASPIDVVVFPSPQVSSYRGYQNQFWFFNSFLIYKMKKVSLPLYRPYSFQLIAGIPVYQLFRLWSDFGFLLFQCPFSLICIVKFNLQINYILYVYSFFV